MNLVYFYMKRKERRRGRAVRFWGFLWFECHTDTTID